MWTIEPRILATALTPGPEVFFQREFDAWIEIAILVFLLRRKDRLVLVDCGLIEDCAALNASMRRRKGARAGFVHAANLADVLPRQPDRVLLSSFGPYAAGGIATLAPGVEIVASRRGLADMEAPEEPALHHALAAPIQARLRRATAISGSSEIEPGLIFEEAGIHHPHSAAILVDTAEGRIGIVDPIFHARNLTEGLALGVAEDVPGWYRLARRLSLSCDALIPIHDPEARPIAVSAWHPNLRLCASEAGGKSAVSC